MNAIRKQNIESNVEWFNTHRRKGILTAKFVVDDGDKVEFYKDGKKICGPMNYECGVYVSCALNNYMEV